MRLFDSASIRSTLPPLTSDSCSGAWMMWTTWTVALSCWLAIRAASSTSSVSVRGFVIGTITR